MLGSTKLSHVIGLWRADELCSLHTNGKASLRHVAVAPDDPRFEQQAIDDLMRGERVGSTFADKVIEAFPELEDEVTSTMNQTAMREKIDELADRWPEDQSRLVEKPLPTGVDFPLDTEETGELWSFDSGGFSEFAGQLFVERTSNGQWSTTFSK